MRAVSTLDGRDLQIDGGKVIDAAISMKGGFEMECKIDKKPAFTVIGSAKVIKREDGIKKAHSLGQSIMQRGVSKKLCVIIHAL